MNNQEQLIKLILKDVRKISYNVHQKQNDRLVKELRKTKQQLKKVEAELKECQAVVNYVYELEEELKTIKTLLSMDC